MILEMDLQIQQIRRGIKPKAKETVTLLATDQPTDVFLIDVLNSNVKFITSWWKLMLKVIYVA